MPCVGVCAHVSVSKYGRVTMLILMCLDVNACACECAALLARMTALKACFVAKVEGVLGWVWTWGMWGWRVRETHSPSSSQTWSYMKWGTRKHLCRAGGGGWSARQK